METFKDNQDRDWKLSINAATVERVKEDAGVDLYEYGMQHECEDPREVLQFQIRANPMLLTRILYAICRRQADALEIDFEQFAEALSGDNLWEAIGPLEAEIVNFTPNPDQRRAIAAAVKKLAEMMDKTLEFARKQTENILADPRLASLHANALDKLAEHSGNMLASLEQKAQTPTPTDS